MITVVDDADAHAAILSTRWHGAWRASTDVRGWALPFDFDDTTAASARFARLPFDKRWLGRMPLPASMRIVEGTLEVDLRAGISRSDLRQAFAQAMAPSRFDVVAMRPAEVRRRFATGRRLDVQCRYAAPPVDGCRGRVTLVDDLYDFRPRSFPSVVAALESSVRILSMCSHLAEAATVPEASRA